ncbi:diguanylate cyclase [Propionivibrio sp.]|uniref:diguanylate cyclase n=1 Tax=Propionivibrio sp. TaxID=2212460 RepID=UPI003BF0E0C3
MKKLRRILVVDGSRVVRATLTKHLKDDFEILEEGDGESARQTLMLNPNIVAIITGIHTPKLEAHDLLARLRTSTMRRLREIPFVLIVSDVDNQSARALDRELGVAGFISKTMNKSEIVECLNNLLESTVFTRSVVLPELPREEDMPSVVPPPEPEKMLESDQFRSLLSTLSFADPPTAKVCALVFGIDNRDALINRFGEDVAGMIATRFAGLLVAKLGANDLIGRCRGERLAIISHGIELKQGVRFGKQVCKSLASGQITIRGQKVKLTASVGVASAFEDEVTSGGELFFLADRRLDQALVCGGNTVATEYKPECPFHCWDKSARKLLDALSAQGKMNIPAHIGTLGLMILPLLQVLDRELALALPLDDIKQQLQQRAIVEEATL